MNKQGLAKYMHYLQLLDEMKIELEQQICHWPAASRAKFLFLWTFGFWLLNQ